MYSGCWGIWFASLWNCCYIVSLPALTSKDIRTSRHKEFEDRYHQGSVTANALTGLDVLDQAMDSLDNWAEQFSREVTARKEWPMEKFMRLLWPQVACTTCSLPPTPSTTTNMGAPRRITLPFYHTLPSPVSPNFLLTLYWNVGHEL